MLKDETLGVTALAAKLKVSRVTIWRWIKDGKLKPKVTLDNRKGYSYNEATNLKKFK